MATENVSMPMSGGGLINYGSTGSKLQIDKWWVIWIIIAVILLLIALAKGG